MKISVNKIATLVAAVAAPVLTALVDQHLLTAVQATDLGAIVAAAIGGLHVNNDQARAALAAVASVASTALSAPSAPIVVQATPDALQSPTGPVSL